MTREHGGNLPRSKPLGDDFFEKPGAEHLAFNGQLRDLFGRTEVTDGDRPFSPSMTTRIAQARSARTFTIIEPMPEGGAA